MGALDDVMYKFSNPADRKKTIIYGVLFLCVFAIILGVAIGVPLSKSNNSSTDATDEERARNVLLTVPLVDGHNDFPWQLFGNIMNQLADLNMEQDLRVAWDPPAHGIPSMTDIPRLKEGLLGAQFWVAYVRCNTQGADAVRLTLEQIDVIKRMINKYPENFEYVTSAQGIEDAFKDGKIGSLIGVEGGHSIDSSLATLRMMYELGVRYMTMTHSCNTPWCDNWKVDLVNNPDPATSNGLSEFGKLVVKEMNRLGMLIDLSHTSVKTQKDTLELTTAPVIYSHSSAFQICDSARNVIDDVFDRIKLNEGVVMVNFYNLYISCNQTGTTLDDVADHIDYIRNGWGAEIVGIGSDYDGVKTVPEGLEDVSTYPALFTELAKRGWSDEELGMLAGNNLLRVLRKAEEVRDAQSNVDPYEAYIPEEAVKNQTCRLTFNEAANISP